MNVLTLIAFLFKNLALVFGIVESVIKFLAGLASLTPTKKDDKFIAGVDEAFSKFKKACYDLSDAMANKKEGKPNA